MAEWLRRLTRNQFLSGAEVRVLLATISFFILSFSRPVNLGYSDSVWSHNLILAIVFDAL